MQEKDINLLILHQNRELWIKFWQGKSEIVLHLSTVYHPFHSLFKKKKKKEYKILM